MTRKTVNRPVEPDRDAAALARPGGTEGRRAAGGRRGKSEAPPGSPPPRARAGRTSSAKRPAAKPPAKGNGHSDTDTHAQGSASATDPDGELDLEVPEDVSEVAESLREAGDGAETGLDPIAEVLSQDLDDDAGLLSEIPSIREKDEPHESPGALVRLDPMAHYLAEIRGYPPLERAEELKLARLFRDTGDQSAAARLITANLILVVKISRLFRRAVSNALDLIQEGNVGLIHALDRFDPEVGVRFSTYAAFWIKAYILKFLLDNVRMVRVGTTNARRKLLYNLHREKRSLEEAGFAAGPRLLAERFGVSEKDVVEIEQSLSGGDMSLDAQVGGDETRTRGDMFASTAPSIEDQVAESELKDLVDKALARFRQTLPDRDALILDTRLLADEPATLQEIGDRYGITREAVRQAEKRLTERLRTYLSSELGEEAVMQFQRKR